MKSHLDTTSSNQKDRLWQKAPVHYLMGFLFYAFLFTAFFSPVVLSGRLLTPGDGIYYYLHNFYLGKKLWDPLLFSGFPVAADPQAMTWYPLSWVFSSLGLWNGFVMAAYVLGSSFMYGYAYTLTQSRLGGIVSGIIYGMSGFMMIHLGHTSIIHAAAWMPLLLWALEKLRHRFTVSWFVIACFAVAMSVLAGHPQVFVYTIGVCTLYVGVFGWSSRLGRWKYYGIYLLILLFGLGLVSIQLIPTSEMINHGLRSEMRFNEFVSYSLHPYQAIELLFPCLFGNLSESFYGIPYFGGWNLAELMGYVGLLSLLLTAIGTTTYRKISGTWFWVAVGLLAFLLTLGDLTPLAKIMYHVPLFNKFRAPGRHFFEVTLAVSILSGLGITAIQKQIASRKLVLTALLTGSGVMLVALTAIFLFSARLKAFATSKGVEKIELLPWSNPAVGIPLVIFLLASITLFFWSRQSQSRFRKLLLLFVLVIDLGSFGWFIEWKYHSTEKSHLSPPAFAQRYKSLLENARQRMVPIRGAFGSLDEIPPNISRLWGVPSASGYGPLILSRISEILSMVSWGAIMGTWSSLHNQNLDVMAIRYVFLHRNDTILVPVTDPTGTSWSKGDLTLSLGSGCGPVQPSSVKINLPAPLRATSIGIVSSMACSTHILDETEVVRILLTDAQEKVHSFSMRAGRDTSEWAYDCQDVLPLMKHKRAQVFQSFPIVRKSQQEEGHRYVATLSIGKVLEIKTMELQWMGLLGAIGIQKISLFNENTGRSYPLTTTMSDLANPARWRHVEDMGEVSVYENLRAMPRAWLVSEVVSVKAEEVLHAIKSSQLPDGRIFNPSQTALVEEPFTFKAKERDEKATAHVVHLSDTRMEVHTNSKSPSFLVLSDVYYPGWKATVDGVDTHLFQTNYVLRGIMLPSGGHVIHLEFKPRSFYYGAGISAGSSLLLILLLLQFQFRKRGLRKRKEADHES